MTEKELAEVFRDEERRYYSDRMGGGGAPDPEERERRLARAAAQALGVELAPERPAAEKRPEWWGRPIPGHADPYYSTVDTLALVDAYEAARKAGVLPGLEAQSQELGNPWLNQVAVTEAAAYREWQAGRNRAMADLTFGGGGVVWCEEAEPTAPERPVLPGWAEEGLCFRTDGCITPQDSGLPVCLDLPGRDARINRAALVEIHRRWLAAKRELETRRPRWGDGSPSTEVLILREALNAVIAILRGEDRA